MARTVLQIPIDPALRVAAEKQALAQGFSSLQDAVRLFLKELADRSIVIRFEEAPDKHLSRTQSPSIKKWVDNK